MEKWFGSKEKGEHKRGRVTNFKFGHARGKGGEDRGKEEKRRRGENRRVELTLAAE